MELTLSDIIRIFKRWQLLFWIVTIGVAILTVGVYKILPKEYEASAVLKVEGTSGTSLGSLGALVGVSGGGGKVDDYIEMLKSQTVLENAVKKLDLVSVFFEEKDIKKLKEIGYDDNDLVMLAANALSENLDVSTLGKSSLISVSFKHKDPELSYKVVNGIIEEFLELVKRTSLQSISKKKEFLLDRISQYEKSLQDELQKYVKFQKEHGIVSLQDELAVRAELFNRLRMEYLKSLLITKNLSKDNALPEDELSYFQGATEEVLGQLINQLVSLENQLVALKAMYSEDNINVVSLKLQIDDLKKRINALKLGKTDDTKDLMSLYKEDMNRFLDVEPEYYFIQSRLDLLKNMTTFTWQQYIQVALSELSMVSPVSIVSKAKLTHIPKTLSTKLVGAIGGALGIFLGILVVFWRETSSKFITDHIIYSSERSISNYHVVRMRNLEKDFKKLTTKLLDLDGIVLITSPNDNDGKTAAAEHISRYLSKLGKKVLLIDADSLKKTLTSKYNLLSSEGFSDSSLKPFKIDGIDFIPSGKSRDIPVIDFERLNALKERYDIVLIDSVDYESDPLTLAKLDSISEKIIVIIAEMNSEKILADELLSNVKSKLHTVIFNKVRWIS
ncbi:MAG: hypothetical protein J7L34_03740 [Thermotogaceae bacterium]|nr:hypothetical protein [Thermotogaceae bacterium]